jgi:hypothetical protein
VQAPQRTAFSGPTLVRLLARLTGAEVTEPSQSLSDQLSQWLGWTDAIALSTALKGNPPARTGAARAFGSTEEKECARVRATLANAIAGDSGSGGASRGESVGAMRRGPARTAPRVTRAEPPRQATAADFPVFRQHYLSMQQAMETSIGDLRARLRKKLAARTPAMTQLAVVDAVMERALGPRERNLLAAVPGLLAAHFERLREAEHKRLTDPQPSGDSAAPAPGAWLDVFRNDMQSVLLAELEVRFQPVEGLLEALRAS